MQGVYVPDLPHPVVEPERISRKPGITPGFRKDRFGGPGRLALFQSSWRGRRVPHTLLSGVFAILCLSTSNAHAQQGPSCPTCPIVIPGRPLDHKDLNDLAERNSRKRNFEAANAARKQLIDDEASKLLILARDLKARTDNLGINRPSPLMLREAALIEFLADDVKEKMKLIVRPE